MGKGKTLCQPEEFEHHFYIKPSIQFLVNGYIMLYSLYIPIQLHVHYPWSPYKGPYIVLREFEHLSDVLPEPSNKWLRLKMGLSQRNKKTTYNCGEKVWENDGSPLTFTIGFNHQFLFLIHINRCLTIDFQHWYWHWFHHPTSPPGPIKKTNLLAGSRRPGTPHFFL